MTIKAQRKAKAKHDDDCNRRRAQQPLLCTCGLTDEEVSHAQRRADDSVRGVTEYHEQARHNFLSRVASDRREADKEAESPLKKFSRVWDADSV